MECSNTVGKGVTFDPTIPEDDQNPDLDYCYNCCKDLAGNSRREFLECKQVCDDTF